MPPHSTTKNSQPIKAVVIGLSSYQNKAIADRCAAALATLLPSPAGSTVTPVNLRLAANEKATLGKWP